MIYNPITVLKDTERNLSFSMLNDQLVILKNNISLEINRALMTLLEESNELTIKEFLESNKYFTYNLEDNYHLVFEPVMTSYSLSIYFYLYNGEERSPIYIEDENCRLMGDLSFDEDALGLVAEYKQKAIQPLVVEDLLAIRTEDNVKGIIEKTLKNELKSRIEFLESTLNILKKRK